MRLNDGGILQRWRGAKLRGHFHSSLQWQTAEGPKGPPNKPLKSNPFSHVMKTIHFGNANSEQKQEKCIVCDYISLSVVEPFVWT